MSLCATCAKAAASCGFYEPGKLVNYCTEHRPKNVPGESAMSDSEIQQEITASVAALTRLRDAIGKRRGASDEHRVKEMQVTASIATLRKWYETLADNLDA